MRAAQSLHCGQGVTSYLQMAHGYIYVWGINFRRKEVTLKILETWLVHIVKFKTLKKINK
jgi:hypothetical protein